MVIICDEAFADERSLYVSAATKSFGQIPRGLSLTYTHMKTAFIVKLIFHHFTFSQWFNFLLELLFYFLVCLLEPSVVCSQFCAVSTRHEKTQEN